MKKKLLTLISCALIAALSLCLAGCSSTQLDAEKQIEDMTVKVPSSWAETESQFGGFYYQSDDLKSGISISAEEPTAFTSTPEESIEISKQTALEDPVNGYDWYCSEPESGTIEGAILTKYEYGYKYQDNEGNEYEAKTNTAFIQQMNMNYEISVWGDDVKLDDILDTVELS